MFYFCGRSKFVTKLFRPFLFAVLAACVLGCHTRHTRIAVIPQTTGTDLWTPELMGAQSIARSRHVKIYWNAPTREDDVKAQIALLEKVIQDHEYNGIVLAPDHSLALMNAVQDALSAGIPVVVVSSRLSLPPGPDLSYILNDDEAGGKMAAGYLGKLLNGKGTVALMGIDPDIDGIMQRAHSFEAALHEQYPDIAIVSRHLGSYNVPHEQQVAAEILKEQPDISAIVALNSAAARGAWFSLLDAHKSKNIRLIGFDQDLVLDNSGKVKIDAIIEQNTYEMGRMAVQFILDDLHHKPVPLETNVEPQLVSRTPAENHPDASTPLPQNTQR